VSVAARPGQVLAIVCAGIALFTAASAACALANSVETQVAFRLVQAAGAALAHPDVVGVDPGNLPG
jgi:MFS family permease